ncbi:uncharacterized protein I206_105894 [Kwoniella pini CBS 10737]|uniref:Amidohydrolase-related domain-containing protein n=1 Tax=Kwoniella pini CBS 10737 TaxID=1296096 RepID=A0A1B9I0H0_9TREE|nr:uncharacterized protein I206_04714 [Kwoniella pini CBS 10737]OCF49027.1 hypothetical protein I206_04714 [Kwoniella pini CBS 10737]
MSEYTVHTSTLFDPKQLAWLKNVSITVNRDNGLITKVFERISEEADTKDGDVDLRGKVVLPGLVDAHTHIFLHAYAENPSVNQKRDESFVERIIRATNHCRIALLSGYTTYRDLGSESMKEADANVRDAINRGLMPGPRLFVATRVIASTLAYEPRNENHIGGTCMPAGCDSADGPDELRKAVRRRIGYGADIIKVYADYRRRIMRFPPKQQHPYLSEIKILPEDPNPDHNVFSDEELKAIVEEAKMAKAPCVAHAHTEEGVIASCKAGVDCIEHASRVGDAGLKAMLDGDVMMCPTLSVVEFMHIKNFPQILKTVKKAFDMGIRIAAGGDTGTFPHGEGVREIELLIQAGLPIEEAIKSATYRGWESCGGDRCGRKFGWFEEGCAADIIALNADPRNDKNAFRQVDFVMKDATIWKQAGQGQGMLEIGTPQRGNYLTKFGLESEQSY